MNPTSRQTLEILIGDGHLGALVAAGARIHQTGCNGCIGMGQAPAIGQNSLRTTPRNFPGRSGTEEDSLFLCSPETATASALLAASQIRAPSVWPIHASNYPTRAQRKFAMTLEAPPVRKRRGNQDGERAEYSLIT